MVGTILHLCCGLSGVLEGPVDSQGPIQPFQEGQKDFMVQFGTYHETGLYGSAYFFLVMHHEAKNQAFVVPGQVAKEHGDFGGGVYDEKVA